RRELVGSSDQVVKPVHLPEPPGPPEAAVDSGGGEVLPRVALLQHGGRVGERGDDVYVVRHHHEVGERVPDAVEVPEAVRDDAGQFRPAEYTGPVAIVEERLPP